MQDLAINLPVGRERLFEGRMALNDERGQFQMGTVNPLEHRDTCDVSPLCPMRETQTVVVLHLRWHWGQ